MLCTNQDPSMRFAHCYWGVAAPSFSQWTELGNVWTYLCMDMHAYMPTHIFILFLYLHMHVDFTLASLLRFGITRLTLPPAPFSTCNSEIGKHDSHYPYLLIRLTFLYIPITFLPSSLPTSAPSLPYSSLDTLHEPAPPKDMKFSSPCLGSETQGQVGPWLKKKKKKSPSRPF